MIYLGKERRVEKAKELMSTKSLCREMQYTHAMVIMVMAEARRANRRHRTALPFHKILNFFNLILELKLQIIFLINFKYSNND